MRKFAFVAPILAGLVGLAGCATNPTPYGNFAHDTPAVYDQKMVDDAVKQLIAVYPPARTRFQLQQVTPDVFGASLVAMLRTRGYAIQEFKPAAAAQGTPATDAAVTGKSSRPTLALRYVLDLDSGSNLYRVTLEVGDQSLTRAYLTQNGSVYPAGSWVRKE